MRSGFGPPAMQGPGTTYGEHEPAYSEDCLVLNVWTPAVNDGGKRPVMFYCHGGGFTTGSGGQNIQDGAHLAATYDVVVVASTTGWACSAICISASWAARNTPTSGNQGMLDIVAALSWVKREHRHLRRRSGQCDGCSANPAAAERPAHSWRCPPRTACSTRRAFKAVPMLRGLAQGHRHRDRAAAAGRSRPRAARPRQARRVPAEKLIAIQLAGDKQQGPLSVPTWRLSSRTIRIHDAGIAALRATHAGRLGSGGGWHLSAARSLSSRPRRHSRPLCRS